MSKGPTIEPDLALQILDMRASGKGPKAIAKWYEGKTGRSITRQTVHNWLKSGVLESLASSSRIKVTRALTRVTTDDDAKLFMRSLRAAVIGLLDMGRDKSVDAKVRQQSYETAGLLSIDGCELGLELEEVTTETTHQTSHQIEPSDE